MSTVIFIRGIPASGKTSLALWLIEHYHGYTMYRKEDLYLVSKDSIRKSVCYGKQYAACDLFLVEELRNQTLRTILSKNYDVVMDETFIEVEDINRAMAQIGDQHRTVLYDLSNVPPRECVQRDRVREDSVGISVIADAYRRLREHDNRMHELLRPFDEVYDGRMETWPSIILS